jgi:hypothetical protein
MKLVATKTADRFDPQTLHRRRERSVSQRTGFFNQIRAFLLRRGVAVRRLRFLRADIRPYAWTFLRLCPGELGA